MANILINASPTSLGYDGETETEDTKHMCEESLRCCWKQVMKFREDRPSLARFLVIQQSRLNMGDKLGDTFGNYEMAVTPIPLFATDGTLLIPSDKRSFMKEVERYSPPPISKLGNNHSTTAVCDHAAPINPERHSRADITEVHLEVDMLTEDVPELL